MSSRSYFSISVPKVSVNKFDYLSNETKKRIMDITTDLLISLITIEYCKYIDEANLSLNALNLPYMLKEKKNY